MIDQAINHFRVRHADLLVERPAGPVLDGKGRVAQFPLLMTVPEVAGILRLSRKGVYDLLRSGGLSHVKIGRRVRVQRTSFAVHRGAYGDGAMRSDRWMRDGPAVVAVVLGLEDSGR